MATSYSNTNIIPLPTAAKRKVRNPGPLCQEVRAVPRLPVKFAKGGRRAYEEANFMRSPEMMIIAAMFKLMPESAKEEIKKKIGTMADLNITPHAASALHILECQK
ncbi:MAG TPA: hypothetical protein VF503_12160 [Sphingobium sp.]|uniref:hypothetical protein n=1 Tax=Sphingobium sp. TaxID=1912891 RepID=UPI002ED596CB